jgi:cytochrome c553
LEKILKSKRPARRDRASGFALILLCAGSCAHAEAVAEQQLALVLNATADSTHGEQLFQACVACHAANASGGLKGDAPVLAHQHRSVLAKQLIDFRYGHREDPRMEGMADKHHLATTQDMADVVSYVSRLPAPKPIAVGDGRLIANGAQIYAAQCSSCHGRDAQGEDQTMTPRLAGQNYNYLLRQLYSAVDGRRANFSGEHVALLKRLDTEGFLGVSDYLSRLGREAN